MRRNIELKDISDGRLYSVRDLVRLNTGGCKGCSYCCEEMVDTIILDPWDISKLGSTGQDFNRLLAEGLVCIDMFDGLTLPRLGERDGACAFLENGRCSIHMFRPGFCRLFPLGRFYDDKGGFSYFLQKDECRVKNRSKLRISDWLGIEGLKEYESYVLSWHEACEGIRAYVKKADKQVAERVNLMLLKLFYLTPYDENRDFYEQYYERLGQIQ